MTTKEMTYQYRLAQWSELVKERVALGISIRAYCAMKGFAKNTYFYWQRKPREIYAWIHENSGNFSIALCCMALHVRWEGYYNWLHRPSREARDAELVSASQRW